MVHDILHVMSEVKEGRLCWRMHIYTEKHVKVLKIIARLESDMHEATKPVIEVPPCDFSICFSYHPIRGIAKNSSFSKDMSTGKGNF